MRIDLFRFVHWRHARLSLIYITYLLTYLPTYLANNRYKLTNKQTQINKKWTKSAAFNNIIIITAIALAATTATIGLSHVGTVRVTCSTTKTRKWTNCRRSSGMRCRRSAFRCESRSRQGMITAMWYLATQPVGCHSPPAIQSSPVTSLTSSHCQSVDELTFSRPAAAAAITQTHSVYADALPQQNYYNIQQQ